VAYKFGDETAKRQGRLTLNPLKHLDPFGTILIFILGFGWARPVPVNRFYFKNPRLAGFLVSIAGPISRPDPCFHRFYIAAFVREAVRDAAFRFLQRLASIFYDLGESQPAFISV
jgi:hypothetical protein